MLATTDLLRVGADEVPWEIRLSRRRRTLAIEVHPEPRVIVRAPWNWPRALIERRLAERAQWIGRHVQRYRNRVAALPPPPRYVTGDVLAYGGEPHRLEVCAAARPAVSCVDGTLLVGVPAGAGPDRVRQALEIWYRARATELFTAILAERFDWFRDRGHHVPVLKVRKMTTRWGTLAGPARCGLWGLPAGTGRGISRMTLNLALIHAPRECSEFVVVHELCHLEHRGHGNGFYQLLDNRLPDWRERKHRLQERVLL